MKTHLIAFVLIILITGINCKKDKPEYESSPPSAEKKWVVTTIAGDGTAAFENGAALSAKFKTPQDVVVAADGAIYVTDADNHRIRKIKDGQVSTFAGSDSGFVNGNGASAKFGYPYSIALDVKENFYVSDYDDGRIRKISSGGDVTTYDVGFPEWPPFFIAIQGMVTDTLGNIFVADTYNQRIRKVSASRQVSTIAGNDSAGFRNGNGAAAKFNYPSGIIMDKEGNLYVPDPYNFRIRKITPAGEVSTFAGSGEFGDKDGDAGTAQFRFPVDIVIDSLENLYVADDSRIRKITPQGIVSTIAGSTIGFKDGDGASAKFSVPSGLGIDAQGNIYVADTFNNRIRKISFE
ncbi:MAG: NHL repeat-containing protein [Sphingobacteriales bacterium]